MYRYDARAKASGRSYVQIPRSFFDPSAYFPILVSSSICCFWPALLPELEAKQRPDKISSSLDFGKRTRTGRNVPGLRRRLVLRTLVEELSDLKCLQQYPTPY